MIPQTSTIVYHPKHRSWWPKHECVICGAKAIGFNFGAPTCAPCKAFFRRNARRTEVLQTPCPFNDTLVENNDQTKYCSQVRYCSSCRLRRCFDMGMKVELVRTDEENERYRQLVETNRRRRQQLLHHDEHSTTRTNTKVDVLKESDWNIISSIVSAYDQYCLKNYVQRRADIFNNQKQLSEDASVKINYHASTIINTMTSFISFLSSIPTVQTLPKPVRIYLCKHNIRPLILLNLHELGQLCYTEPWQLKFDNSSSEYILGSRLFSEFNSIRLRAEQILVTDPVITRLWLLILFFSTPLNCYFDHSLPILSNQQRILILNTQNSYIDLLWNYLLHRHGDIDAVRIFSNLNGIYLRMQRISQAVNAEIRTRFDLTALHEAFNRAVIIDSDDIE